MSHFWVKAIAGATACTPLEGEGVRSLPCSVAGCAYDWQCRTDSRLQALEKLMLSSSMQSCHGAAATRLLPACAVACYSPCDTHSLLSHEYSTSGAVATTTTRQRPDMTDFTFPPAEA